MKDSVNVQLLRGTIGSVTQRTSVAITFEVSMRYFAVAAERQIGHQFEPVGHLGGSASPAEEAAQPAAHLVRRVEPAPKTNERRRRKKKKTQKASPQDGRVGAGGQHQPAGAVVDGGAAAPDEARLERQPLHGGQRQALAPALDVAVGPAPAAEDDGAVATPPLGRVARVAEHGRPHRRRRFTVHQAEPLAAHLCR